MLTVILYALLAILVVGVLFVIAAFLLPSGEQIAPPVPDDPPWTLPADRALHADDVNGVRLPIALRGYRFAETDFLLDRLAEEIRVRDAEIVRLGGSLERRPVAETDAVPEGETAEPVTVHAGAVSRAAEVSRSDEAYRPEPPGSTPGATPASGSDLPSAPETGTVERESDTRPT